jgi:hypothetical protein
LPRWNGLAGASKRWRRNHCPETIAKHDRSSIEYDAGEHRKGGSSAAGAGGGQRPVAGKSRHKKAPDNAGAFEPEI